MNYKVTYIFYFKDKKSGKTSTQKASRIIESSVLQETIRADLKKLNEKYPDRTDYCYTKTPIKNEV